MNIHEFCAEAVKLSSEYPEFTVAAWGVSGLLMLVQAFFLMRRLTSKVKTKIVQVPYVPGENVLKFVKLIENEASLQFVDGYAGDFHRTAETLFYGDFRIYKKNGEIEVLYKETPVDLGNARGGSFVELYTEFDQQMLIKAFDSRVRKERTKVSMKRRNDEAAQKDVANTELARLLEKI